GAFLEFGAGAGADRFAVEHRHAALLDGPSLADDRVVDDADHDLAGDAEGDGDAEMGDAVEEIHRAVDGIDDPLAVAVGVAAEAFLAVEGVAGAGAEENVLDELLRLLVEGEL